MNRPAFQTFVARTGLAVAAAVLALPATAAPDFALRFPAPVVVMSEESQPLTTYLLPVGPFQAGAVPVQKIEGRLEREAWRIPASQLSTLGMMQTLRGQITTAGFAPLFECEAEACGGFDFRYGTTVLPEPEMHVDLGDFRFLAAQRQGQSGKEYLSLLVSRSPLDGYVQLTRIGALAIPPPDLSASTKTPAADAARDPAPEGLAAILASGAPLVLEDLLFASGAGELQPGEYASLAALSSWLRANPGQRVMLVGHTDASGGLAANIALSKQRAQSVRQVLLTSYGVDAGQVDADGVGPLAPRAGNLDAEGQRKNRRVEVFRTSTP